MKYFTKEWYETSQKTSMHLLLKVSKHAELFSEDYFKKLYKSEERAWLKLQQAVANVKFEDLYPEEFSLLNVNGSPIDPKEYEEMRTEYFKKRELAAVAYADRRPFDSALEKKKFKQTLYYNAESLKLLLPKKILGHVADIRVLALNRTSALVKREITEFCKTNRKIADNAAKDYRRYYHKAFKNDKPSFAEAFQFHDCKVVSCRKAGEDLIIG